MLIFNFFLYLYFSILLFSFLIILLKNPIYSIICLILVFLNSALLILLLGLEFLALLILIVYIGGISVLFLFVIMMLNIKLLEINESFWKYTYLPLYILLIIIVQFFLFFIFFLNPIELQYINNLELNLILLKLNEFWIIENFYWIDLLFLQSNVIVLGIFIFSFYSYGFIYVGVILLLAMVSAILFTIHPILLSKKQELYQQVNKHILHSIYYSI